MALAVFGIVVLPWVSEHNDHDITAASQGGGTSSGPRPELPDVVELHCSPGAIDVPVASIRPQSDGLHLEVVNDLGKRTWAWVVSPSSPRWDSGRFPVPPGRTEVIVTPPPGPLTVGCDAGDDDPQQRQVDLVDINHVYSAKGLDCPVADQQHDTKVVEVPRDRATLPTAVRAALTAKVDGSRIEPNSGYLESPYKAPTDDPSVRLVRGAQTVAIVHLTGTATSAQAETAPTPVGPWVGVHLIEYCPAFITPATGTSTGSRAPS